MATGVHRRYGSRLLATFALWMLPPMATAAQESETSAVRALKTRGMKADVAALILSGQEGGTLPMEVLALPLAGGGDKARVPLLLEIDGSALASGTEPLRLEIFIYALAQDGGLKDVLMQAFEIDRARLPPERVEQIKFLGEMALGAGRYTLRVLARDAEASSVSVRSVPVTVPGPEAEPSLSAPILTESRDARLLLEALEGSASAAGESALALVLAGPDLPAVRPVIRAGEERTFRLVAHHLDEASSQLMAELTNAQGQTVAEMPSRVKSYSAPAASGGFRVLTASLEPGRLEPGEYRLRVIAQGSAGERVESAPLSIVVAGLHRDAGGELAAAPAERATRRPRRARLRKRQASALAKSLSVAYEKALGVLASGQPEAALDAVLKLEQDIIASKGVEALGILQKVENETVRRIANRDPESLEPVMLLQFQLYCEARKLSDTLLSTHARNAMLRFVELYLDASRSPEAETRAARFLVSLAGELQKGSMVRLSEGLFLRVLELDETNEAALLGLAARHEKVGNYRAAIQYSKALVDAYPDHGHGRLRLAINLARDGKSRAARRHLREIVAADHDSWILSLAYQELAKFYLEKNLLDEAEKILREGLEKLPGEERLYIALAFVFDARQEPGRAQEVLAELARQPASKGKSARHRYTRYPSEALAKTRRLLDLDAQARLPDLLAVLASTNRVEGLL